MLHLLLIEDNSADVLMIREALRQSPIPADVMIAYDGEQALRMLEEFGFKPDFVILDLNIPKFDGHEILKRYHSAQSAPVVVFTSSANGEDKVRAFANGARDYVIKPTGFNPFVKAIHGILERWGKTSAACG